MIFNMVGGGGGSGATLVVSSPVNISVTVSKDDKSYTKNSGSLGSTTFKGLATGTWTVIISGNGQTATKTIEITADYAITIAFFSATINITYPANSNCVVTNSGGQTVASDTNTTSSEKTFIATVNAKGTYTVTATATDGSGNTKSESVEITSEGQSVGVALSYITYLYNNGDQYEDLTGGWTTGFVTGDAAWIATNAELNADNMFFNFTTYNVGGLRTVNKIDLTKYSSLIFTYTQNTSTYPSNSARCLADTVNSYSKVTEITMPIGSAYVDVTDGELTSTLDVTELTGEYYITIISAARAIKITQIVIE